MCKFGSVHVRARDFSKFRSWRPQASKQLLPVNPVQFDSVQVHSQPWADYCNGYREICQVSFLTSSKTAGRLVNNSCPLCRRRIGLPLKNLEFPDSSCGPVTFGLGLPPKNLEFPDCSYSPVAFRLGLPPKNLEFPDCSCSPVTVRVGLPPKKFDGVRARFSPSGNDCGPFTPIQDLSCKYSATFAH